LFRKTHWVSSSKDKKIGDVVASYSPKSTCPDSCSLKTGGCYAWGLFYLNILGGKIENGTINIKSLTTALSERRVSSRIVRHRVAGDIVGDVPQTLEECHQIEKEGLINIGYTHAWREDASQPLKKFFRASCQNEEEVLEARSNGWSATLIVTGDDKRVMFSNGETGYLCPARHDVPGKHDITCNTCTLCKVTDKTANKTVMFRVHGNKSTLNKIKNKVF
jgi:hypothetical protein